MQSSSHDGGGGGAPDMALRDHAIAYREHVRRITNPWLEPDDEGTSTTMTTTTFAYLPPKYPATMKEERKCVHELRSKGNSVSIYTLLSNGMRATEFALAFVMRHHLKRKNGTTTTSSRASPEN